MLFEQRSRAGPSEEKCRGKDLSPWNRDIPYELLLKRVSAWAKRKNEP